MSERLTLYYMPGSYYSQKAVLAFLEKNAPFNHHHVDTVTREYLEPWYFKLNPLGKIPLLKDGDKLIAESEDIIKFVDEEFKTGSTLVPEGNADYDRIHNILTQKVPIEIVSYGTMFNPDMSKTGLLLTVPAGALLSSLNGGIEKAKLYATQHKELKEDYLKKVEYLIKFRDNSLDRDNVQRCIDALQPIFDELETQLIKSTEQNPDSWLINTDYTSADITMTVLLSRMVLMGHSSRYFTQDTRPHVYQYWSRVQQRKSFQDLTAMIMSSGLMMKK